MIASVPDGAEIHVWVEEDPYTEDDYKWYGVWWGEHVGWMALVRDEFAQQFVLELEPEPEVETIPLEQHNTIVAGYELRLADIRNLAESIVNL